MEIMKCHICGETIYPISGDEYQLIEDNKYMCGKHYSRINKLTVDCQTVEKLLEDCFGGCATVRGEAEFIIDYK